MNKLIIALKELLYKDNTGIKKVNNPKLLSFFVIPFITMIYWIFFQYSIIDSLYIIVGKKSPYVGGYLGPLNEWDVARDYLIDVLLIIMIVIICIFLRHLKPLSKQYISIKTHLLAFCASYILFTFSGWIKIEIGNILYEFNVSNYSSSNDTIIIDNFAKFLDTLWNIIGPLGEETIIVLLLSISLRRCNIPWGFILTISPILRTIYHLYQGWQALSTLILGFLLIIIFKNTGSFLGIAIAHCTYDLVIYLNDSDYNIINICISFFAFLIIILHNIYIKKL